MMARGRTTGCLFAVLALLALASTPTAGAVLGRRTPTCQGMATRFSFGMTNLDASHVNAELVFTNVSGAACALDGAPRVRFVARGGKVIGNASVPGRGGAVSITLEPGAQVHAMLRTTTPSAWPPAACRPTLAWGVLVAAPSSAHWWRRHFPLSVCAGRRVHESTTAPLAAGPGPVPAWCTSAQLTDSLGRPQRGDGATDVPLVFTNPVLYTCTLRGYPTVRSVRGAAHDPVGPPAVPATAAVRTIWLQPFGGRASSTFAVKDTAGLPAAACRAKRTSGVVVTAPHTAVGTYLVYNHVVCQAAPSTTVSPLVAGSSG
jgi:hypothetical protein